MYYIHTSTLYEEHVGLLKFTEKVQTTNYGDFGSICGFLLYEVGEYSLDLGPYARWMEQKKGVMEVDNKIFRQTETF